MAAAAPPPALSAELIELFEDLSYVGFDTREFRQALVAAGVTGPEVMKMLTVYMAMGNNPFQDKRKQKARDPAEAERISTWLATKGVRQNASEGNPVTLGRLAKAYAPVLLAMRRHMGPRLRSQLETRTPIDQCDLAFLGYDRTVQCRDAGDFTERFGAIITKANPRNSKLADEEVVRRNRGYAEIARAGLERDATMRNLLNSPQLPSVEAMMTALHRGA
jgi:hypothetical protein